MFSKSIEYGYRIIIFLRDKDRMTGQQIIDELDIPKYYGLTILKQLSNANILESSKGKTGGFLLKKRPITFLELYQTMNDNDKKMSYAIDKKLCLNQEYLNIISALKEKLKEDMMDLVI